MAIVRLPFGRSGGNQFEHDALLAGVAGPVVRRPGLRVIDGRIPLGAAFCAACASPIEFGAVTRGMEIYCSIECSLGGDRPA